MSMQSITTWTFKPNEPLTLARRFASIEGTALLYSGKECDGAQSSFLCLFPEKKIVLEAKKTSWETLKEALGTFDCHTRSLPRFVGYLGYEMGCFTDVDISIPYIKPNVHPCLFYIPSTVIHFEHLTQKATLYATQSSGNLRLDEELPRQGKRDFVLTYTSDTLESYIAKIAKIKEWILEGEVYQVNLSQEMHVSGAGSAYDLFEELVVLNPSPFSAFVNCNDYSIVSTSPERFLCKKGDLVQTRPIKGTLPRGKNSVQDKENHRKLLFSEKERAELLMITDLMRSDLGKIARAGSVQTRAMWQCDAYTNVFHLLSIIEAQVARETHPVELIRALFPGGSITGCPKLRAMAVIADLEKRPRGIYTGSIGYIAENGDFDFNIAIRNLIVHPDHIQLQLGGGIVIDSDPVKEFEETLHKGHSLLSTLGIKELIIS